ncbi:unnamed protein product [Heterobilharzia americana]|nr:unnamed protein product [Heterobilharzia americana]
MKKNQCSHLFCRSQYLWKSIDQVSLYSVIKMSLFIQLYLLQNMLDSQLVLSVILALLGQILPSNGDCVPLGGICTKTIFAPCCNNTVCKLKGPFNGKCVSCLDLSAWCYTDSECCSGNCDWFKCRGK